MLLVILSWGRRRTGMENIMAFPDGILRVKHVYNCFRQASRGKVDMARIRQKPLGSSVS